jgi:hypothetical protein
MDTTGDADTEAVTVGSTQEVARRTGNGETLPSDDGNDIGDYYLQFRVDDAFLYEGSPTTHVRIEVEYLDHGTDRFGLQYDAHSGGPFGDGRFRDANDVTKTDTGEFKTVVFRLRDAFFANRDNGADFRISDNGDGAETITRVSVIRIMSDSADDFVEDVYVWVLDNVTHDFDDTSYQDTITILDGYGNVINTFSGINLDSTIGGGSPIAVHPEGASALVAQYEPMSFSNYALSGEHIWSLDRWIISSTFWNGDIYALTTRGLIYGETLLQIDPGDGSILRELNITGRDLAVDDAHQALWIVGADIKRLNLSLEPEFNIDPIEWVALSVDFLSDGSVWVSEGQHPDVEGSENAIMRIAPTGEILQTVVLEGRPYCVAVDRSDNSVWVATTRGTHKYHPNGELIHNMDLGGWCVRVSQLDGTAWVAHFGGLLARYTQDGIEIASVTGFSGNQTWIGIH